MAFKDRVKRQGQKCLLNIMPPNFCSWAYLSKTVLLTLILP